MRLLPLELTTGMAADSGFTPLPSPGLPRPASAGRTCVLAIAGLTCGLLACQPPARPPEVLAAVATARLASSLEAASAHLEHAWRDAPALNPDGTVNAYIEIRQGDRRKWELDMGANARAVDRVIPESVGGYPVNYGFVPQTVSYDGDPFDALVLGPPIEGGETVRGAIVGLMRMHDEKGLDSKVVLSPVGPDGRPLHALTDPDRQRMADYFRRYKLHEAGTGAFAEVPGWGTVDDGRAFVRVTHGFFEQCRQRAGESCQVTLPAAP
jgi:inorganic pyrophosphatase